MSLDVGEITILDPNAYIKAAKNCAPGVPLPSKHALPFVNQGKKIRGIRYAYKVNTQESLANAEVSMKFFAKRLSEDRVRFVSRISCSNDDTDCGSYNLPDELEIVFYAFHE